MRLLEWTLATFHTCLFFTVVTLLAYLTGNLGQLLASLNTLIGILIFLVFWTTTWFCTRGVIRRTIAPGRLLTIGSNEIGKALVLGSVGGGLNGVLFFLAIVVPGIIFSVVSQTASSTPGSTTELVYRTLTTLVFYLPLLAVVGSPIAFIVGTFFGFLLAIIDGLLIGAAQSLARYLIPG